MDVHIAVSMVIFPVAFCVVPQSRPFAIVQRCSSFRARIHFLIFFNGFFFNEKKDGVDEREAHTDLQAMR